MLTISMTTEDFEEALVKSLRPLRARPSASFIARLASMPGSVEIAGTAVVVTSATIAAGKTTVTIGSFATSVGGVATSVAAVGMGVGIALTVVHHQPGPRQDAVTQVPVDIAGEREEPLNDPPSNPRKPKTSHKRPEVQPVQAVATDLEIAPRDEHPQDAPSLVVSSPSPEPTPPAKPEARPRSSTTLPEVEKACYRDTINRWKGGLDPCKRAARQRGAVDIAGEAIIKLVLNTDGDVRTVDFASKTVRDKELIACVERAIKRWKFEPSSGPISLDFPLDFVP